ncbi:GMC family oxidoreductase [Haematomicrobium sanguinis]|uniref:GMC family oxidoreductase n=1 Tax=Haematomicrobium sanguinis TaxID=479106 RepID=UPI0005563E14|nr:GMC oxidoreductase [Haematomicrobium sanguinis]
MQDQQSGNGEEREEFDFIVVGTGAGGGPLAANLAEAGFSVLVLEAGHNDDCPYYQVPVFHARASEDPDMRWDFFVRHYPELAEAERDEKFVAQRDGVLYPRGSTVGGSTAVSAMITLYPHRADWDYLAQLTGDPSWGADNMHRYFERIEHWFNPKSEHPGTKTGADAHGHGYNGWLPTTRANPSVGGREQKFLDIIDTMDQTSREEHPHSELPGEPPYDPNSTEFIDNSAEGMIFVPVAVGHGVRFGSRERLVAAASAYPNLTLRTDALVTRVLTETAPAGEPRAIGVEYLQGSGLYSASPLTPQPESPTPRRAYARKEVILSAGAFNTPQLLKLSGIGPKEELENFDIPIVKEAPGVGRNLQDRYEISVVDELAEDYPIFAGAGLDVPHGDTQDPLYTEWTEDRDGPYTTNGSLAAYVRKSRPDLGAPDLFIFSLPVDFRGYYPGYADAFAATHNKLSWVILKGHTHNRAGTVALRSADPRDTPAIDFRYFDESSATENSAVDTEAGSVTGADDDLRAVVDGIRFARGLSARLGSAVRQELVPGAEKNDDESLAEWVRYQSWGHHASCSVPIGADEDPMAVLDGDFRLRGVSGLRVVDASVFPRIPGFFVALPTYMVAEKASDVILADHRK